MPERSFVLAYNGKSSYKIYVPSDAAPSEKFAAEEFSSFFAQVTGVTLPYTDNCSAYGSEYLICIGQPPKTRAGDEAVTTDDLGEEGIRFKTFGGRLIITGGRPRGVLYAVYQFLEEYLGCRWFAPDCTYIPQKAILQIPEIDFSYIPTFSYRNASSRITLENPLWAARNRLNATTYDIRFGGASGHGPAGHSFYSLVPPEEYFDAHPEYFSMINGERTTKLSQLCLSNPEVLSIVTEKLRNLFRSSDSIGASFAQNDWLGPCECSECRKIDGKYGAYSGSIINFCNKLCENLHDEFPDRHIKTYAYLYGQIPPKGLKVHDNVEVWICSAEACHSHPHGTCDKVRRPLPNPDGSVPLFHRDLVEWGKICKNLYVWDYNTDFRNFLQPHPNLQVLPANIRFFRDNGIKGCYMQNCNTTVNTEMQQLRAYIIAKHLWDPDYNDALCEDEFLNAWFGKASSPIKCYIEMLKKKVKDDNCHLYLSTMPNVPEGEKRDEAITSAITRAGAKAFLDRGEPLPDHALALYMTPEILQKAKALFDRAERMADNAEILERVQIARLPIRFTEWVTMRRNNPEREQLFESFFSDCSRFGIAELKEAKPISESYTALKNNSFML